MTTTVLVIQGAGRGAHEADRAIADELQRALGGDFQVEFPCMPGEDDPEPAAWKRAIAKAARDNAADAIVAHSAGGAMLADLLAEGGVGDLPQVRSVLLLAPPYVGKDGWALDGFHLDAHRESPLDLPLSLRLYFGEDDETVPAGHAALYRKVFARAVFTRFATCDHQFGGHVGDVARDVVATLRN